MTGSEISLRGRPTGRRDQGKVAAAHRAGIKTVLIPEQNRKDLKDIPEAVLASSRSTLLST